MDGRPGFTNFDLHITGLEDGRYAVSVRSSPAGETLEQSPEIVTVPYKIDPMRRWLQGLAVGCTSREDLLGLGLQLTSCLLPSGRVRDLYQQSLGIATAEGGGLRIRLHISSPDLALLPWEYAYDESIADFFVLNPRTVLVRYHNVPAPPLPISSLTPVPVLAVLSNPPETPSLATAETLGSLLRALNSLLDTGQVRLDVLFTGPSHEREAIDTLVRKYVGIRVLPEPATIDALRNALRQPYRIVHYVGHGGFHESAGGGLFLADERGQAALVTAAILTQELRASSVAVVVLNACHSAAESSTRSFVGLGPSLIRAGVPAVIAMLYAIQEDSAARFSAALYQALVDGWPLDAAVTEGRKAVRSAQTENDMDWGIPILFMRSPDGVIWKLDQTKSTRADRQHTGAVETAPHQSTTTIGGPGSHIEIAGDFVLGSKTQITDSFVQFGGRDLPAAHHQQPIAMMNGLRQELARAASAGSLSERDALAARALVDEAIGNASSPFPDRQFVVGRLSRVEEIVRTGTADANAAANLAALFAGAVETILRSS